MLNHNKKRNILVITSNYAPDYGPSAPIFTWLCEDLAEMGNNVTVITGVPNYAQNNKQRKEYPKRINREQIGDVSLLRIRVPDVPKDSMGKRLAYQFVFNLNACFALSKVKNIDVILADAPTLWSGLPLFIKSIIGKTPFIYIVFDIYPDVLEKLGYLKSTFLSSLMRSIEKIYYRKSKWVTVLSEGFKKNLEEIGVSPSKLRIIPTCVDVDFIHPIEDQNHFKQSWKLEEKFVILYAGNIGLSQGLEHVVNAAKLLEKEDSIEFVFVGEGATLSHIQQMVQENKLSNIQFHSFLPFEEIPYMYAAADVCLVSMKPELVIESVPSKTFTIMASGKPIIATVDSHSEVGRLLIQADCGICVPPGNDQALADAIIEIYKNKKRKNEMAHNSRIYVEMNYSRKVAAKSYQELINFSL